MRAKRIDNGQGAIVDYLRAIGWSVHITSNLGGGFPDLVVSRARYTALVEVKDGTKPPSARQLTDDEREFRDKWPGDYVIATSPQDAAEQLLALWRGWKC